MAKEQKPKIGKPIPAPKKKTKVAPKLPVEFGEFVARIVRVKPEKKSKK
jgi:hypothetical protein